ncbi:hypothetical protein NUACC26_055990 [Scytonema sp. NUACC26]
MCLELRLLKEVDALTFHIYLGFLYNAFQLGVIHKKVMEPQMNADERR